MKRPCLGVVFVLVFIAAGCSLDRALVTTGPQPAKSIPEPTKKLTTPTEFNNLLLKNVFHFDAAACGLNTVPNTACLQADSSHWAPYVAFDTMLSTPTLVRPGDLGSLAQSGLQGVINRVNGGTNVGIPLTIQFNHPMAKVGLYLLPRDNAGQRVTLRGFGQQGQTIETNGASLPSAGSAPIFIGIGSSQGIWKVELNNGSDLEELTDELYIEPLCPVTGLAQNFLEIVRQLRVGVRAQITAHLVNQGNTRDRNVVVSFKIYRCPTGQCPDPTQLPRLDPVFSVLKTIRSLAAQRAATASVFWKPEQSGKYLFSVEILRSLSDPCDGLVTTYAGTIDGEVIR